MKFSRQRKRLALTLGFVATSGCSSCEKQQPPPKSGLDREGILRRSDAVHEDLKKEEDRAKERQSGE
jgi:hypothetical protein